MYYRNLALSDMDKIEEMIDTTINNKADKYNIIKKT